MTKDGENKFQYEDQAYVDEHVQMSADGTPYAKALDSIRQRMAQNYNSDQLAEGGPKVAKKLNDIAREIYLEYNDQALNKLAPAISLPIDIFVSKIESDVLGMGPLEPLLRDPSIEDIAINGPDEVMIYANGKWEKSEVTFESHDRLLEVLNRAISSSNRRVNMVTPIVDAVLPGGERINVGTSPIANPYPVASIRIPRATSLTLADMVSPDKNQGGNTSPAEILSHSTLKEDYEKLGEGGMISAAAAAYLHAAVLAGLNIIVIGPTGVGKTTMLSALGRCIPELKRILVIEDTPEINIHPDTDEPKNVVYLRTRPKSVDGLTPPVTQADLVQLALRHRPDALTLGEVRGPEVFDLLNALNTGHKNGLTSIHAAEVSELFNRIFLMLGQSEEGRTLDKYRAAYLVSKALHIALSLELVKTPGAAARRIKTIGELTGNITGEDTLTGPEIVPIFKQSGKSENDLQGPLVTSAHAERFAEIGVPEEIYSAGK